jgi:TatA/E family protein of Tat protein translocase
MGLGWQELLIVLVIIMVIFGAGKLPDVMKTLGVGVKQFKQEATAPIDAGFPADVQPMLDESGVTGTTAS